MGRFKNAIREEALSYDETEWVGKLGTVAVTLTAKPLTPHDMTVHAKKHPNFLGAPTLEGMVDMLIQKAMDDTGEMAFDRADKPMLMRCSNDKIGEIFGGLFGEQIEQYSETEDEFEARVKNSKGTGNDS